jgi:hypothetical protein
MNPNIISGLINCLAAIFSLLFVNIRVHSWLKFFPGTANGHKPQNPLAPVELKMRRLENSRRIRDSYASGWPRQFDETIVTNQRLARALQPEAARVIGSEELRGSVTLALIAGVHLCSVRVVDLTGFDSDPIGGSSRLRVVTTDLTFVHYLSLCWLDCPGLLMSGGARDRFSLPQSRQK